MALSYKEAANGYPIAVLPGANLQMIRSSQSSGLFEEAQQQYGIFVERVLNSRKAVKRANKFGRQVLSINGGANLTNVLANSLDLDGSDKLFILEEQTRRIESVSRLAVRMRIDPASLIIGEGNFLASSFSNMMDLMLQRMDVIVFGLGTPSVDRSRKDGSCRVQAELTKSAELLREGGSLLMAPSLIDTFCVEEAIQNNRLQKDNDREIQRIGNTRAMRVIAMR